MLFFLVFVFFFLFLFLSFFSSGNPYWHSLLGSILILRSSNECLKFQKTKIHSWWCISFCSSPSSLTVVVGEHDFGDNNDNAQEMDVRTIVVHEDYKWRIVQQFPSFQTPEQVVCFWFTSLLCMFCIDFCSGARVWSFYQALQIINNRHYCSTIRAICLCTAPAPWIMIWHCWSWRNPWRTTITSAQSALRIPTMTTSAQQPQPSAGETPTQTVKQYFTQLRLIVDISWTPKCCLSLQCGKTCKIQNFVSFKVELRGQECKYCNQEWWPLRIPNSCWLHFYKSLSGSSRVFFAETHASHMLICCEVWTAWMFGSVKVCSPKSPPYPRWCWTLHWTFLQKY